jgi:hypothetical protein
MYRLMMENGALAQRGIMAFGRTRKVEKEYY